MFCVKCGRPAEADNFCKECFLERQKIFDIKDAMMIYCDACGVKEEEIIEKIEKSIKSPYLLKKKISIRMVGNRAYATIMATAVIQGFTKEETKKSIVTLKKRLCDLHVKLSGGYYEAMIQVRGEQRDRILRRVESLLPQKAVINVEKLKEGYNVKVMRKSNAAAVAKSFVGHFEVKSSFKLVGSKKGQMLYRNFYSIR